MKRLLALILSVILMFSACGCRFGLKKNLLGGDAICYSYCVFNDSWTLATIPLIYSKEIESVTLIDYNCGEKDIFTLTQEPFTTEEHFEYRGYNVYFLILKVQASSMEKIVHSSIDSLLLDVDGKEVTLNTPHFKVSNGIDGIEPQFYNDGTITYGETGEITLLHPQIPTRQKPASVGLLANENVVITEFGVLDYFSIDYCEVKSTKCTPSKLELSVEKDDGVEFRYSLKYENTADENHIVRVARYFLFTENGQKKAFINGSDVYVYPMFNEYKAVKNYIDSLD